VQPVLAFISSATYEEKRELVSGHPELLMPKAEEIMARIAGVHRKNGSKSDAAAIEAWREFLVDARSWNFDYALAKLRIHHVFVEMPDSPAEWNAYLQDVAQCEGALRSREGDRALAEFAEYLEGVHPPLAAAFQGLRSLVKRLREHCSD
jgi:hypothetical protein